MARVTSKLQVTIPKVIADRYGIVPGADIDWLPAGDAIRVVPNTTTAADRAEERAHRLELFDRATERQHARQAGAEADRGCRREDLYERGRAR